MSKIKDPQEKKRLSYEKDRRNCYGESDKGSRKSIRKNKKASEKAQRSKSQKLKELLNHDIDEDLSVEVENEYIDATKISRSKGFRKVPDQPLKEHIEIQERKRGVRYGRKKNS